MDEQPITIVLSLELRIDKEHHFLNLSWCSGGFELSQLGLNWYLA